MVISGAAYISVFFTFLFNYHFYFTKRNRVSGKRNKMFEREIVNNLMWFIHFFFFFLVFTQKGTLKIQIYFPFITLNII